MTARCYMYLISGHWLVLAREGLDINIQYGVVPNDRLEFNILWSVITHPKPTYTPLFILSVVVRSMLPLSTLRIQPSLSHLIRLE